MTSPGRTSTLTSFTAWTPPNETLMLRISISRRRAAFEPVVGLRIALRLLLDGHGARLRFQVSRPTAMTRTMPATMFWIGVS